MIVTCEMACIVGCLRPFVNEQNMSRNTTAMARPNNIMALNAQGLTRQKIADQLGTGVASVYRILKNQVTSEKMLKASLKKMSSSRSGENANRKLCLILGSYQSSSQGVNS